METPKPQQYVTVFWSCARTTLRTLRDKVQIIKCSHDRPLFDDSREQEKKASKFLLYVWGSDNLDKRNHTLNFTE